MMNGGRGRCNSLQVVLLRGRIGLDWVQPLLPSNPSVANNDEHYSSSEHV